MGGRRVRDDRKCECDAFPPKALAILCVDSCDLKGQHLPFALVSFNLITTQ
jgi:hypothetical protein